VEVAARTERPAIPASEHDTTDIVIGVKRSQNASEFSHASLTEGVLAVGS
jgi:hypothetical protein